MQFNDCPVPCHSLLEKLGAKIFKIDEKSKIGTWIFYFSARTMVSDQLELYTSLSLIAEIGGYVGLILGASLWNFVTWISNIINIKYNQI